MTLLRVNDTYGRTWDCRTHTSRETAAAAAAAAAGDGGDADDRCEC